MAALALSDVSFYLQPSNVAQPRIELSNVQTNTLGRSAKWHIKDAMISREQILMQVDRVRYPDTPVDACWVTAFECKW
jgi:FHA domain